MNPRTHQTLTALALIALFASCSPKAIAQSSAPATISSSAPAVSPSPSKESSSMTTPQPATYTSVPMDQGIALMAKDQNFILLDVRTPEEYAEGHIPGAKQLTNETFTRAETEALLPEKAQTIYVYCRSGRRSKNSAQKLVDFGYTRVIEIGGILSYTGEIER